MTIHVSKTRPVIGVPAREDICNIFSDAPLVTYEGNQTAILHHGWEETRLLRNLGLDVPAPILRYDYEGGKPFDIQRKTAELLTTNPRAYVLNGMGTGKTKASLWAWKYLYSTGDAGKLLVIAPLSTLAFTWAREIFDTLPGVKAQVLHGSRTKRLDRFADPAADIYIINHDGVGVIYDELMRRVEKVGDIDTVIFDELAVYRNGSTERSKKARAVAMKMKWVWGMTGSPVPNDPTDAWGLAQVVTPHTVPKYFGRFRDQIMMKVSQFRYVPKSNAMDTVFSVLQPAVRFTLDDVVELPDLIERTVDLPLGVRQQQVYSAMEKEAHIKIASKEITAMNAGAVLNKLLQISAGWVYTRPDPVTNKRDIIQLDNGGRLDALCDAVLASSNKVLVFVPFKHALEGIGKRLKEEGIDCHIVSGDTPSKMRGEIFNIFQLTDDKRPIIAHPQCMAHGVTLTRADTIIWYAPTTSLEIFEQANARIRRVGQKSKQLILMFASTKAERNIYARLRSKQKVQNMLLDMIEGATGEIQ